MHEWFESYGLNLVFCITRELYPHGTIICAKYIEKSLSWMNWGYWPRWVLTHCRPVSILATDMWVNIGSGNGLLSDGNKPWPEQCRLIISGVGWHSPEVFTDIIRNMCYEIIFSKILSHVPGANESNCAMPNLLPFYAGDVGDGIYSL